MIWGHVKSQPRSDATGYTTCVGWSTTLWKTVFTGMTVLKWVESVRLHTSGLTAWTGEGARRHILSFYGAVGWALRRASSKG
jgi:hypothetical protein